MLLLIFQGVAVRVRRPTDYNPSVAAALGPSQPSPNLNLSAVGLVAGYAGHELDDRVYLWFLEHILLSYLNAFASAIGGTEGPDRIFVGGLPYYFTEEQIKELLQAFG